MINRLLRLRETKKNEIILFLIVFMPFLVLLLYGRVIFWGTTSLQFIPWYQFFFDTLINGDFPLWNPYNGMGVPFIANHQSAVFYPLNWVLLIFYLVGKIEGLTVGVTLLIPLHLFISGLGIMRILEKFGISKFPQLMGGMVFAYSGYILTRLSFISMVWTYAWLPWIIFMCMQLKPITNQGSLKKFIYLSIFLSLQLLGGHAQTSYYTIMLGGVVVLFYNFDTFYTQIKKIFVYISASILSIMVSAVQIFPTAEFLMESQRSTEVSYEFAVSLSLWPARLLTILFGNFWGNPNYGRFLSGGNFWEENLYAGVFPVITLIILFWVLFWKTRKNQISTNQTKIITFLFAILVFSILFSFGKFFPLFPFLYKNIPTFSLFQAPVRFLIIYFFTFSLLFGFGVDVWILSKFNHKKTIIILVVFGTLFFFSLYGKIFQQTIPDALINSILIGSILGLFFGFLTLSKDKYWINLSVTKLIFGVVMVGDLLFHNFLWENFQPVNIFSSINQKQVYSEFERVFVRDEDEKFLKFNVFFRPDRLQPLVDYEQIPPDFIPETNLLNNRYAMINNFDPLQPEKYTKLWNWLNGLSMDEQITISSMVGGNRIVEINPKEIDFITEEIINAKTLVQWYGCEKYADEKDTLTSLLAYEIRDPENRCVLINHLSSVISSEELNFESIQINFSMPSVNSIVINYTSDKTGWIVVRQNWFPGWKAILDAEEELTIENVDYLFQGVIVPEGKHSIEFKYKPKSFSTGLLLSIISVILILISQISYSLYRKSKRK
ncbi:MAG: hypothetical protein CVU41_02300 [Chloroflexi bacterium HGW-Chloroflexi-3]|nr:MAG: hypothetical protein CVU41_02300 [Chloroflexi bacterium HGW-Chloroflexi-3]